MAATGRLYTPPDIIKRQAMRANLLAKATATNFGGFRSSRRRSRQPNRWFLPSLSFPLRSGVIVRVFRRWNVPGDR
jgi:hypothetical protein